MATYKTSWVQRLVDNVWTKTFAFAHAKTVYTDYENGKTLDKSLEEVQKRISDNGYGEIAGGKNLLNPSLCKFENVTYSDGVYTQVKADTNKNIIIKIRPFSGDIPLSTILWETITSPYIAKVEFTKNSTFDSLMIGFNGSTLDTVVNYDCSHLTNGKKYKCIVNFNNIQQGTLSFIPMITEDLSLDYTDYEKWYMSNNSLTEDVADLRSDVDGMLTSVKVSKVYYNLAGNSFDSETAGKTMIANVNFANFKNKSMIVSGDFIISSLPFITTKKGDYLEVRLSKSDYPELASKIDSGIKKLAFGISGNFNDKVVGHVNCGLQDDYIRIWLTFNDTYNFNTADLQTGIADFFF